MVQTYLGIDYGKKRVGIAVGNSLTQHAEPLEIIQNSSDTQVIQRIIHLIREWQVSELVLGMPTHPDGTEHEMTRACIEFELALAAQTQIKIALVDERYTSAVLPNNTRKNARGQTRAVSQDDQAACIILQQYLASL